MKLKIAQLGQPVLRQPAAEVPLAEIQAPEFQRLLDDMQETLADAHGAGLAGPQVFASKRVFLAATRPTAEDGDRLDVEIFINPRIVWASPDQVLSWEGCLSFLELLVLVPRHRNIRVQYQDREGRPRELELEGFPARVVQHENDHLDGILTLDRAPSTRAIIKASEIEAALGEDPDEPDA